MVLGWTRLSQSGTERSPLDGESRDIVEDAVVGHERYAEAHGSRRHPAIRIVLTLGERVTYACTVGSKSGVGEDEFGAGVHNLGGADPGLSAAIRHSPQPRRRAP